MPSIPEFFKKTVPQFLLFISLLSGCAISNVPHKNILMFNSRGQVVDASDAEKRWAHWHRDYRRVPDLHKHINERLDEMNAFFRHESKERAHCRGTDPKLLIYIHGGMKTRQSVIEKAKSLHEQMKSECYFPLFINWNASLSSSYFDHLLYVRQGRDIRLDSLWYKPLILAAPLYLAADFVRGAVRTPVSFGYSMIRMLQSVTSKRPEDASANMWEHHLLAEYGHAQNGHSAYPDVVSISTGTNRASDLEKTLYAATWLGTLGPRLAFTPVLDGLGRPSWDIMNRRTKLLFNGRYAYEQSPETEDVKGKEVPVRGKHDKRPLEYEALVGGLHVYMHRLQHAILAKSTSTDLSRLEISLIGHSMGTIILNNTLREFPDIHFSTIVYMGAACTVRDYVDSVLPYLKRHAGAQMYHLTLHRDRELQESHLTTHGSLLVWIDDFLAAPHTLDDMTIGRYTNLLAASHHISTHQDIRGQVHIKSFDGGHQVKGTQPLHHGDFDDIPRFWDHSYWAPWGHTKHESALCVGHAIEGDCSRVHGDLHNRGYDERIAPGNAGPPKRRY